MNEEKIERIIFLSDFLIIRRELEFWWKKDYLSRKRIKFDKYFEEIDYHLDKKAFSGFLNDYLFLISSFDDLFENKKIKEKKMQATKTGEFLLEKNIVDEFEILISQEEIEFIKRTTGKDVKNIFEIKKYIEELIKFMYDLENTNK